MKRFFCAFMLMLALASSPAWAVSVLGGLTHQMTPCARRTKRGHDSSSITKTTSTRGCAYPKPITRSSPTGARCTTRRAAAIARTRDGSNVSPLNVTIPPKESVSIFYEITAPNDPGIAGTYWSIIMVEPIADAGPGVRGSDGKVALGLQTVIRYAVQIISDIGETGSSTITISDNKVVVRDGKTLLQTDVANVGERWLSPSVWTEFYDKDGRYVGRFDSNRQRVLPSCSVRHLFDLTSVPRGTYTALFVVDNGDDRVFGTTYEVRLQQ